MKVFVTRNIPSQGIEMLKAKGYEVVVSPHDRVLAKEELIASLKADQYDAVLCLLTDKIDAKVFDAAGKQCKIFANYAVGFDNVDLKAAQDKGIMITNTPGVLDETTADFAWTLLMTVARRLIEGDQLTRSGTWAGWNLDQLCGADVWGKTLGLVGFGRIGRAVARRAAGFGMRILYNDAIPVAPEVARQFNAEFVERDRLFAEADFISLHVPLLPQTRNLISHKQFSLMKPGVVLMSNPP